MHPPARQAAALLAAAVSGTILLAGCAGGSEPDIRKPQVAPSAAVSDPCLLLSAETAGEVLGDEFRGAPAQRNDLTATMECIITTTQTDPVGMVIVATALADGARAYERNLRRASGYWGTPAAQTQIAGADKAYLVTDRDLRTPVVGMLVGDTFVELRVGAAGASEEQGRELAELVAARIR